MAFSSSEPVLRLLIQPRQLMTAWHGASVAVQCLASPYSTLPCYCPQSAQHAAVLPRCSSLSSVTAACATCASQKDHCSSSQLAAASALGQHQQSAVQQQRLHTQHLQPSLQPCEHSNQRQQQASLHQRSNTCSNHRHQHYQDILWQPASATRSWHVSIANCSSIQSPMLWTTSNRHRSPSNKLVLQSQQHQHHQQQQQYRGFVSSNVAASVAMPASLMDELQRAVQADESQSLLTPAAVVERLDKVIVGQQDAKRAVAIAFRNRWRRQRVTDVDMRGEITPKNLLLMGPTGCGKTEIARRLAKLAEAPFVKVEATKFTEVGYHGRDVDSIIRDLVEVAQTTVKQRCKRAAAKRIAEAIESHILHMILGEGASHEAIAQAREKYRAGQLEDAIVEIEVPTSKAPGPEGFTIQSGGMSVNVVSMMGPSGFSKGKEKRTMTVAEARPYLEEMETDRQFPPELIIKEAIRVAEQEGIVFIDEIDKIVNPSGMIRHGSDPSAEGVQRDLLPLIEGSVVSTKHGPVATDHMLFIASGAFTRAKPSDMMAELQGRLPIRVELKGLTAADFEKILTEPDCNMIFQQQQLLGCEGVDLVFTSEAVKEIAALAEQINKEVENIGARRLHTVLERLVEDISFEAPDKVAEAVSGVDAGPATDGDGDSNSQSTVGQTYVHIIDKKDVQERLADLLKKQDLDNYII